MRLARRASVRRASDAALAIEPASLSDLAVQADVVEWQFGDEIEEKETLIFRRLLTLAGLDPGGGRET